MKKMGQKLIKIAQKSRCVVFVHFRQSVKRVIPKITSWKSRGHCPIAGAANGRLVYVWRCKEFLQQLR